MNIEHSVHQLFIKQKWTLALAESCTGGAIAACLTRLPGASGYFLGGVVAYSNAMKESVLQVPSSVLLEQGAVSEETVHAMAQGLLAVSSADFCLSISGIAGPAGGTAQKPVGTVWVALLHKGSLPISQQFQFKGSREEIISASVTASLELLYQFATGFI